SININIGLGTLPTTVAYTGGGGGGTQFTGATGGTGTMLTGAVVGAPVAGVASQTWGFATYGSANNLSWSGNDASAGGNRLGATNIVPSATLILNNNLGFPDEVLAGHLISTTSGTPATSNLGANVT